MLEPKEAPLTAEQIKTIQSFAARPQIQADIFEGVRREVWETAQNFPDREMD